MARLDKPVRVAIALGSNLGDRLEYIRKAVQELTEDVLTEARCSSIYETPPWGMTEQPSFLNAVVIGKTDLDAPTLVTYLKQLEKNLGRTPGERNGPREIDLDLLFHGETQIATPEVEVPHPRLATREFVLLPLVELEPGWIDPVTRKTVSDLLGELFEAVPATARVVAQPIPIHAD